MASTFDAHAPAEGFRLTGADKLAFVTDMFDRVAPTYDLLNWFISLGQTTLWRLAALSWLHRWLPRRAEVLDVGCGTGWVSWFFRIRYRALDLRVTGMDCSPVMLREARRVVPDGTFYEGDVCHLPHPDDSFDAVVTVYTLRNFPNLAKGLEEMYRVTKPSGAVVILDAFPPQDAVTKGLVWFWLEWVAPVFARIVSADPKAYKYLSASIRATLPPGDVANVLRDLGAERVEVIAHEHDAVGLHCLHHLQHEGDAGSMVRRLQAQAGLGWIALRPPQAHLRAPRATRPAALLLLVAACGTAALRVTLPSSHGVRARAASARMAYQKVNVPSAEEARKKNPTAADRPAVSQKYAGVKAGDRDTKKNKRNKIMKKKQYVRGGSPFDRAIHSDVSQPGADDLGGTDPVRPARDRAEGQRQPLAVPVPEAVLAEDVACSLQERCGLLRVVADPVHGRLQLRIAVEPVIESLLSARGDDEHLLDARRGELLDDEVQAGPIDQRQHLLGDGAGDGQEARAVAGRDDIGVHRGIDRIRRVRRSHCAFVERSLCRA